MTEETLETADAGADGGKVPAIAFTPSRMMHDYLSALAGGTMGKNPTAVAQFLLTREVQRLIEAKHVPGLWY